MGIFDSAVKKIDYHLALETTHQSAATATGDGTIATMTGTYYSTVAVQIKGAGIGILIFEADYNDGYWVPVALTNLATGIIATTVDTSIFAANGQWWVGTIAGAKRFRVRISNYSSGALTASSIITQQSPPAIQRPSYLMMAHHAGVSSPANGNTAILYGGYNDASISVNGAATISAVVELSVDAGFAIPYPVRVQNYKTGEIRADINATGIWRVVGLLGMLCMRVRLASISGGTISIISTATSQVSAVMEDNMSASSRLTALEAIQASVEDTTGLTANGALRTGADGWTSVLIAAGTTNLNGSLVVPEGARRAWIVLVNGTDVAAAVTLKFFGFGNLAVIAGSQSVAAGVTKIWAPAAEHASYSATDVVGMLGVLVPGLPMVWAVDITSRTTGTDSLTIYWGS